MCWSLQPGVATHGGGHHQPRDVLDTGIDLEIGMLDGGETSVNFAEAALLLQGTASVYSKMVEFL